MIIRKLYKTRITCSHYHASVSYPGAITVTVKLTDFNDEPVIGESATITVNEGKFSLDGIDKGKSFTGRTDDNGVFSVDYYITGHGLITFECNSSMTQIHVGGWEVKELYSNSKGDFVKLYVNQLSRICELRLFRQNVTFKINGETSRVSPNLANIPEGFRPVQATMGSCYEPEISIIIHGDGTVDAVRPGKGGTHIINGAVVWHY